MADRLDELFEPHALRRRWAAADSAPTPPVAAENQTVHELWDVVLSLLDTRFADLSRISYMLNHVEEALTNCFGTDADVRSPTMEERTAVVDKIQLLEELIWALELAQPVEPK